MKKLRSEFFQYLLSISQPENEYFWVSKSDLWPFYPVTDQKWYCGEPYKLYALSKLLPYSWATLVVKKNVHHLQSGLVMNYASSDLCEVFRDVALHSIQLP